MNFYICSLLLLFLRQIFTISSTDGISASLRMLCKTAIAQVIVSVCQSLSVRLICEGTDDQRSVMNLAIFLGVDMFGTLAMTFELALLAVKYVSLAIAVFLLLLENKLIVESFWELVDIVRSIGIWHPKKSRKPPGKNKIGPNPFKLAVTSFLLLSFNDGN